MYYLSNLIYEKHNTLLQYLSCISEISYVTKSEDGNDLLAGKHRVNVTTTCHILRNNF